MIEIRPATDEDCRGIAEVQVDSYRTAYAGLYPVRYLEQFRYEEQEKDWRELVCTDNHDLLWVAVTPEKQVIGYILARAQPDIYPGYDAEIVALHVRLAFQERGTGSALLRRAVEELAAHGCRSLMLWTLQGNPRRAWYERLGGRLIGAKHLQVDDWDVVEVAYGWESLDALQG